MRTGGSDPNQHHVSLLFVMTGGEVIWWEVVMIWEEVEMIWWEVEMIWGEVEMIWGEVVPIKILERQRR